MSYFPPIIISPTTNSNLFIEDKEFNDSYYLFNSWNQQEIVDDSQNNYYMVPIYITQDRDRLPKTKLSYGGLVTRIPLRTDNSKYFWAKRSLALICHVEP